MMARRGRWILASACTVALLGSLLVTSALAAGKGSGNGGGGGHETTSTNNLSVPTIMVGGGGFTGVTCGVEQPSALVPPTGVPLSGYPIDPAAYFYVQGVHTWQAQCYSTTAVPSVTGAWGDNLSGDAKLSVGKPIRVELGLFDPSVSMDGYAVVKLDPNALDRESAYGTLATPDGLGGFSATPTTFSPVRVFDAKVTFSIKNVATGAYVVAPGTNPTAEINATGSVVYGYNLRVATAGEYEISFSTPSVTVTGVDVGTFTANTITLVINVTTGGGGGGGQH
jgi:hypothetical protein